MASNPNTTVTPENVDDEVELCGLGRIKVNVPMWIFSKVVIKVKSMLMFSF